jgi:hypothetical protein
MPGPDVPAMCPQSDFGGLVQGLVLSAIGDESNFLRCPLVFLNFSDF